MGIWGFRDLLGGFVADVLPKSRNPEIRRGRHAPVAVALWMSFRPVQPQRALPHSSNSCRAMLRHRSVQDVIQQRNALEDVRRENLMDQRPIDGLIQDGHLARYHDPHDWLPAAPAGAAGLPQQNVVALRGGNVFAKLVANFLGAGGVLAGGRADLNEGLALADAVLNRGLGFSRKLLELLHYEIV